VMDMGCTDGWKTFEAASDGERTVPGPHEWQDPEGTAPSLKDSTIRDNFSLTKKVRLKNQSVEKDPKTPSGDSVSNTT